MNNSSLVAMNRARTHAPALIHSCWLPAFQDIRSHSAAAHVRHGAPPRKAGWQQAELVAAGEGAALQREQHQHAARREDDRLRPHLRRRARHVHCREVVPTGARAVRGARRGHRHRFVVLAGC